MDFRGFDSRIMLSLRGGILMSIGNFLEDLSQTILVGIIVVGKLGVSWSWLPDLAGLAGWVARVQP